MSRGLECVESANAALQVRVFNGIKRHCDTGCYRDAEFMAKQMQSETIDIPELSKVFGVIARLIENGRPSIAQRVAGTMEDMMARQANGKVWAPEGPGVVDTRCGWPLACRTGYQQPQPAA